MAPPPLVNGALCLSTPQHNGKSGTVPKYKVGRPLRGVESITTPWHIILPVEYEG